MSFLYDASGNRIEKKVITSDTTITTHYIRDASGNVMATYTNTELKEQPIYGSSRVGMYRGGANPGIEKLGLKNYELSNHLGNVMAVITDNINIDVSEVTASVASVSDYYPFGLSMEGRTFSSDVYRYGFNGKEKDPEGLGGGGSTYDYGFRIYNPSIAKFLSVDPLTKSYPWYTPYQFAGNNPIKFIDLDGLEEYDPMMAYRLNIPRLVTTAFYDIKHSAEGLLLNTFVPADPGKKWLVSYKVDENGDEIFETVIQQVPREGALKETLNTALDVVNVVAAGKLDPTDVLGAKTGSKTQVTRSLRKFLDPTSFRQLAKEGIIDPSQIRFSQNSIKSTFSDGRSVADLTKGLKDGSIDPASISPIRIVEKEGNIFTLDNRRLKAFQDAGVEIPFQKVDFNSLPKKELDKFTTTNNGESIRVRGIDTD